jgi:hypothetical protein
VPTTLAAISSLPLRATGRAWRRYWLTHWLPNEGYALFVNILKSSIIPLRYLFLESHWCTNGVETDDEEQHTAYDF